MHHSARALSIACNVCSGNDDAGSSCAANRMASTAAVLIAPGKHYFIAVGPYLAEDAISLQLSVSVQQEACVGRAALVGAAAGCAAEQQLLLSPDLCSLLC